MTDIDTAIRAQLADDAYQLKGADPDIFDALAVDRLVGALLALVDEHEQVHRRLGEPQEDHTSEGLPMCEGWPYRLHADRLCRHVRTIAEKLGIET